MVAKDKKAAVEPIEDLDELMKVRFLVDLRTVDGVSAIDPMLVRRVDEATTDKYPSAVVKLAWPGGTDVVRCHHMGKDEVNELVSEARRKIAALVALSALEPATLGPFMAAVCGLMVKHFDGRIAEAVKSACATLMNMVPEEVNRFLRESIAEEDVKKAGGKAPPESPKAPQNPPVGGTAGKRAAGK